MNSRLVTIDFFDSETQKACEHICPELAKIKILLCSVTGKQIGNNETVYYDKRGIISEEVRTKHSLFLGTLDNLRLWCEKQTGIAKEGSQIEPPSKIPEPAGQMKKPSASKKKNIDISQNLDAAVIKASAIRRIKGGPKVTAKHAAKKAKPKTVAKKHSKKRAS